MGVLVAKIVFCQNLVVLYIESLWVLIDFLHFLVVISVCFVVSWWKHMREIRKTYKKILFLLNTWKNQNDFVFVSSFLNVWEEETCILKTKFWFFWELLTRNLILNLLIPMLKTNFLFTIFSPIPSLLIFCAFTQYFTKPWVSFSQN